MGCYLRNLGSTRPPGVLLSAMIPWICKSELLNPLYRRYISALFYVGLLLPFHFCWSHHYVGDLTIFCPHFLLLFILPVLLLQYIYIHTYIHTHTCSETSYRITDVECIVRAKNTPVNLTGDGEWPGVRNSVEEFCRWNCNNVVDSVFNS